MGMFADLETLPSTNDLSTFAEAMLSVLEEWRGQLVFSMMILECLPVAGFIVPGQITLAVAGFWAASQPLGAGLMLCLAALGGVILADAAMYGLGRFGTKRFAFVDRMVGKNASFSRTLQSQSTLTLLFYQFPPYSRMFAALLLGSGSMKGKRFFPIMLASSFAFVLVFMGIGWGAGLLGVQLTEGATLTSVISALFALAFFGWAAIFARQWWRTATGQRRGAKPSG
jgi:membrane protein DedA with SNARE-associated domain